MKNHTRQEKEDIGPVRESKRSRVPVTQYQAPNPELQQVMKQSLKRKAGEGEKTDAPASRDDQTIVFFKGEHMAVRNADGGFFLCVSMQNVYKKSPSVASKKVTIQWLSEAPDNNPHKDIYVPEYYDKTEFETILTSVELDKLPAAPAAASKTEGGSPAAKSKKGKKKKGSGANATTMQKRFRLPKEETERIERLLQRSVDRESGKECDLNVTEDNPDGLDISIYKDEDQLKELERKRKREEREKNKPKKETPASSTSSATKKPEAKKKTTAPAQTTKKAAAATTSSSKANSKKSAARTTKAAAAPTATPKKTSAAAKTKKPAPTPPSRTTSKRNSKMDAQKAMELAAKDEAEDVDMGLAEEEEGPAERLEQGPPKAPAKAASQKKAPKAPKAQAKKRQVTVVKTAASKPRTAADAMKAKKEASAAAKGKKGKTPAAKAKKPAAKSSKANAPAKPAGLAAAARGRGRAAASRAKDSIAAEAIDEDEPEETGAAPTEKAADNKVEKPPAKEDPTPDSSASTVAEASEEAAEKPPPAKKSRSGKAKK